MLSRPYCISAKIYSIQDRCRAEHCRFEMSQEASLGATDFQNRPDIPAPIESGTSADQQKRCLKRTCPVGLILEDPNVCGTSYLAAYAK